MINRHSISPTDVSRDLLVDVVVSLSFVDHYAMKEIDHSMTAFDVTLMFFNK